MALKRAMLLTLCLASLFGCGGGGSGGGAPGGTSGSTLTGTVAVGAAVSGASIEAKCVKGSASATSLADGTFSITISGAEFPCLVRATGGTVVGKGANTDTFFSAASGVGRVNLTPLNHFIVAKALGKQPADVFSAFGSSSTDNLALSATSLLSAQNNILPEIAKLGINASLGTTNLMTAPFVAADNDPIDQFVALFYQGLSLNSKTLASATQELVSSSAGIQIVGALKGVCRPGVLAGFAGKIGTDEKLAYVPVAINFEGGGGGDGAGPGGDGGAAGDGALGQFFGTKITVEKADGTLLGSTKTSATSGTFTMITCGYTGPLKITATGEAGAQYFDEGLGQVVSFEGESMRVVVDSITKNVGITPFTEAAYGYLTTKLNPNGLTGVAAWADPQRIAQANAQILKVVNRLLPKEFFLTDITRMPSVVGPSTAAGSIPDSANGIYGLAIAALALQTKNFNAALPRPGLDSMKQLAKDLSDGVLDRREEATGQSVSTGVLAAYTAESLGASVTASAGQLAKQVGVASLASRRYSVTRIVWSAHGASYRNLLPGLGSLTRYAYVDLLSDGSIQVINPADNTILADSLDQTKSPFLDPQVGAATRIVKLTGTSSLMLALDSTGKLYAAGEGGQRQGNGNSSLDQPLLHPVNSTWGGASISTITAGGSEAFVRVSDGQIWGWGNNGSGVMADYNAPSGVPVSIFTLNPDFLSVSVGDQSAFAIKSDGTVWSWGQNTVDSNLNRYGRLGRGTSVLPFANQAAQISGLSNVTSVVAAPKTIYALTGRGEVYVWGNNYCNSLGDSVASNVSHAGVPGKLSLTNVIAINGSGATGFALKEDGTLVYWGSLPLNPLDPRETWIDRSNAVCKRLPIAVPFPAGDPLNPGFDSSTKFVKLEKLGFGVIATTAAGQFVLVYGSNSITSATYINN